MRFGGKPAFEAFSPGRRDKRVNEAAAMLSMRPTLANIDARGLSSLFNLKPETAAKLIEIERGRRAAS